MANQNQSKATKAKASSARKSGGVCGSKDSKGSASSTQKDCNCVNTGK